MASGALGVLRGAGLRVGGFRVLSFFWGVQVLGFWGSRVVEFFRVFLAFFVRVWGSSGLLSEAAEVPESEARGLGVEGFRSFKPGV